MSLNVAFTSAAEPELVAGSLRASLMAACTTLISSPDPKRRSRLGEFVLEYVDQDTPNDDLLGHLIAQSLLQRIDHGLTEPKNVYVQELEVSQTQMFYLAARAVPFIPAAHSVANKFLSNVLVDAKSAVLLELGVGHGYQLKELLREISSSNKKLKAMRVIAIDPVEENLEVTGRMLHSIRDEVSFPISYVPIAALIEEVNARGQLGKNVVSGGTLVINAAFSLHHTRHPLNDRNARTALLRRLAALGPKALALTEPSSNHNTENLPERLDQCWNHFGQVYALVDESSVTDRQKFLIKTHFFGREIRDLFGVEDHLRCERHELYETWATRLSDAGFRPAQLPDITHNLPSYCKCENSKGLVRFIYKGQTIAAVFCRTL